MADEASAAVRQNHQQQQRAAALDGRHRQPVADRPHGAVLRSARDRIDGRGIGTALKVDADKRRGRVWRSISLSLPS